MFALISFSPSSPSPVTQQMTTMSISQESGAVEADQAETEEGDDEDTSNSTGKPHISRHFLFSALILRKHQLFFFVDNFLLFKLWKFVDLFSSKTGNFFI